VMMVFTLKRSARIFLNALCLGSVYDIEFTKNVILVKM